MPERCCGRAWRIKIMWRGCAAFWCAQCWERYMPSGIAPRTRHSGAYTCANGTGST